MSERNNIFTYLENIVKQKDFSLMQQHIDDESFDKTYSQFMINRYLSMHHLTSVSMCIIKNQKALERLNSNASHYMFLMKIIPQNKNNFITYIK